MNTNDIYNMALNNVRRKRREFHELNVEHENEIVSKVSEYAELKNKFMNIMRSVFSFGDFEENLKKADEARHQLDESVPDILVRNGYPMDYLVKKFYCTVCEDVGDYCESCIRAEVKRLTAIELNKSSSVFKNRGFDEINLDYYGVYKPKMSMIYRFCISYAEKFTRSSPSVLMCGNTGLGKTHFSLAIAKKVIEKNYNVVYHSSLELFDSLSREYFGHDKSSETKDFICQVDLLIIDDLGVELDNKFYKSCLYEIFERRRNSGLPTIFNTNLSMNSIAEKYGERISSRFFEYVRLDFVGQDIRQLKSRER